MNQEQEFDIQETSARRKTSRLPWFLSAAFILIVGGLGLWFILSPESLARLYGRWQNEPLVVESLVLSIDRQVVELPPQGAIEIHPGQRFAINSLVTNRWRNYDLLLRSPDFDLGAVTGGASSSLRDILPEEAFDGPRKLRIIVLDGEDEAASFEILTRFTALDYAIRGDAAEDPLVRAGFYRRALELDPGAEAVREKLVKTLTEAGRPEEAAAAFEVEITRQGAAVDNLTRLLSLYESQNNRPGQVETLGRLIGLVGEKTDQGRQYRRRQAEIYQQAALPAEAAAIYERLVKDSPETEAPQWLGRLVIIYREMNDSPREIDALKRLAEVAPPNEAAGIWSEIIKLYDQSGEAEGRIEAWRGLARQLPEGEAKVNAYKRLGFLLAENKQHAQAREAFEAALALAPDDLGVNLSLARLAAHLNDRKTYRARLSRAVEISPDDLKLRRELAEALARDKQNGPAKAQHQEIIKRTPNDLAARLAYIAFLEATGDRAALVAQYDKLAELNPKDQIALYNLGSLHFERREWDKAIAAFKKALALDDNDDESRQYLLRCYQQKNQRKEIIEQAMELYRRHPSETVYRTLMLNTQENAKDWKGFAEVAKAVTELEPDKAFGWSELARAQKTLKQNKEAAESLWRAAELTKDKTAAAAWLRAAEAAAGQKQNDRARQGYQKVIELDPKNARAIKALKDIDASANK